ncbi:MAG: ribosome small subunit-dependent GTPase A [Steroidobacteraceae bacterium]
MPARLPIKDPARSYAGDAALRARVVVTHGRRLRVRTEQELEASARPARRDLQIVCGDWVRLRRDAHHNELHVLAVEPRSSAIYRSNAHGGGEIVAANLTLLLVVLAPLPQPDFFIADRYLAAARCAGISAGVVLNKADLPIGDDIGHALRALAAAGYPGYTVSAAQRTGLMALQAALVGHSAMLVGQSGTGKSSLLHALAPDSDTVIGTLTHEREGRHTTTATRLYPLPHGGELLDSPGVRDFAPSLERLEPRALGFPELETLSPGCRFADCRHLHEPDCAVRAAVGAAIDARRYESYRRLRRLYDRLRGRGPPA